jgi:hypothetical protein
MDLFLNSFAKTLLRTFTRIVHFLEYSIIGIEKRVKSHYLILFLPYIASIFSVILRFFSNLYLNLVLITFIGVLFYTCVSLTLKFLFNNHPKVLLISVFFVAINVYCLYEFRLPENLPSDYFTHYQSNFKLITYDQDYFENQLPVFTSYPITFSLIQSGIGLLNLFSPFFTMGFFLYCSFLQVYSLLCFLCFKILGNSFSYSKFMFLLSLFTIFDFYPGYSLKLGSLPFIYFSLIGIIASLIITESKITYSRKFLFLMLNFILLFIMTPAIGPLIIFFYVMLSILYFKNKDFFIGLRGFLMKLSYAWLIIFVSLFSFILVNYNFFIALVSHFYQSNYEYIQIDQIRSVRLDLIKIFTNQFLIGTSSLNFGIPLLLILYFSAAFKLLYMRRFFQLVLYVLSLAFCHLSLFLYMNNFVGNFSRQVTSLWLGQIERVLPSLLVGSLLVVYRISIKFTSYRFGLKLPPNFENISRKKIKKIYD